MVLPAVPNHESPTGPARAEEQYVVDRTVTLLISVTPDAQLHRFRSDPANRGKVCQMGIWNYSRHPNYFFEILLWSGFAFIGLPTDLGWLGLISPITLLLTMRFITGPISERQSLKSKPDTYRQYQKTTSMIVPWFNKS